MFGKAFSVPDHSMSVPIPATSIDSAKPAPFPVGIRPIVRIHLLGAMRATTYLGKSILPRGKKARALLGYLCLSPGKSVERTRLTALLWDRVPSALARSSLRQALSELISAFEPVADELISTSRNTVRFNVDSCWVDVLAVLADNPRRRTSLRSELTLLCHGELLEGLEDTTVPFAGWLRQERSRFSQQMRTLLAVELHQVQRAGADPRNMIVVARGLLSFEPTNEGASRLLMRALADAGDRHQALVEYARCREALRDVLGAEPSPETRATLKAVRTRGTGTVRPDRTVSAPPSALPVPCGAGGRLRVGVLPFHAAELVNKANLGFSLSQEIAAGLARFRWFDVISPISLRRTLSAGFVGAHQHQHGDIDYVVDGAISGSGKYFEINVRLLDLADRVRPVWSETFHLAVSEFHRLHELVTVRIVARIDPVILHIEGQPKRRERYGATGLLLLAIPKIFSMERKQYEEAGELIARARGLEPDNAMVEAWAAHWHVFHVGQGWAKDPIQAFTRAQHHALKAITLDPDNAEALGICGHCCSIINKDFDAALNYFDRSLRLNPSLAFIWALSATTYCYIGEPDRALERLERYRELAPHDPYFSWFETTYTIAYTFKGDYERAVLVGRRVVKSNPEFTAGYKPLIASLGHLGRHDEAQPYVRKLRSLEPDFTVEHFGKVYPFKKRADRERYLAGLRLAGVPER